jgi:hypothetical protein
MIIQLWVHRDAYRLIARKPETDLTQGE